MTEFTIDASTLEKLDNIAEKSEELSENNSWNDTIEHLANSHMIREGFTDAETYDEKVESKKEELKAMIRGNEQDIAELEETEDSNLSEKQRELKNKISSGR